MYSQLLRLSTARGAVVYLCFFYLTPQQNYSIVTSQCMQFTFEDKGEVYLLDESVLPVAEKERRREGKIL